MSKKITVLIFVLLLTLPLAKSQDKPKGIKETIENKPNSGKIYALICGVSEYQDKNIPKLDYAHIDAYNFYKYIISGNFGVVDTANIRIFLNENATAKNLISNLDVLKDKVLEGDKVIIFFSGHGDVKSKKRAKTGYLLMYNACYPTYEGEGAIRLDEFSEACMDFSDKKCDVILFIDACHSGSLSGGKDGAQILTDNLKGLKGEKSEIIKFLSSNGNEFSKEGDAYCNGGGAFTCFLIKGMLGEAENNNGKISVYDLSEYIRKNVREATNKEQNPVQYSSNENYIISY
ncbi:MAG: caspase family protein, partial [Ignavibacteriae bacterium]|nr:caspase family protein [Ignavibacteriota bacterium]